MDRWISILSRGFRAQGVAAAALCPADGEPQESWLGRLAALTPEYAATLSLDLPPPAVLTDFVAGALRADIVCGCPRFAMIIDSDARCRRTLRYRLPGELPSPLELIGWAVAQRKRDHAQRITPEALKRERRRPTPSSEWPPSATTPTRSNLPSTRVRESLVGLPDGRA